LCSVPVCLFYFDPVLQQCVSMINPIHLIHLISSFLYSVYLSTGLGPVYLSVISALMFTGCSVHVRNQSSFVIHKGDPAPAYDNIQSDI